MRHRTFRALPSTIIALAWLLVGGGCRAPEGTTPGKTVRASMSILCTTYPVWLFAREVCAGTDLAPERLVPASAGCPHEYVMGMQDRGLVEGADVLLANGLGLDATILDAVKATRPDLRILTATAGIGDLLPAGNGPHTHEHADSDRAEEWNPHLFASPARAAKMVRKIGEELAKVAPDKAAALGRNAERYASSLEGLAGEMRRAAAKLRGRAIVTQHNVFDYLAADLGLQIAAVVYAHPGEALSAAEVREIVEAARRARAGAVFTEPQYPEAIGRTIARELGVPAEKLDPVASGPEDPPRGYYEQVMRQNLQTLLRVLGETR